MQPDQILVVKAHEVKLYVRYGIYSSAGFRTMKLNTIVTLDEGIAGTPVIKSSYLVLPVTG